MGAHEWNLCVGYCISNRAQHSKYNYKLLVFEQFISCGSSNLALIVHYLSCTSRAFPCTDIIRYDRPMSLLHKCDNVCRRIDKNTDLYMFVLLLAKFKSPSQFRRKPRTLSQTDMIACHVSSGSCTMSTHPNLSSTFPCCMPLRVEYRRA